MADWSNVPAGKSYLDRRTIGNEVRYWDPGGIFGFGGGGSWKTEAEWNAKRRASGEGPISQTPEWKKASWNKPVPATRPPAAQPTATRPPAAQPTSTSAGSSGTPSGANRWYISGASGGKAAFGAGGGIAAMKADPSLTAAEVQRIGMKNLRAKQNQQPPSTSGTPPASRPPAQPPASSRPAPPPPTSTAPKPSGSAQTGNRQADLGTWAKANKEMIQKVGTARQKEILAATEAGKPIPPVKKLGENLNNTQSSLEVHRTMNAQITETYDAYDLVLEYLLETGHAETVNEANYIMLQMDSDMIGNIVEGMVKYLQD